MDEAFGYDGWLEGMQKGRTFITNGPALFLDVEDKGPGDTIRFRNDRKVTVRVTWWSHYPVNQLGIVHNGRVVKRRTLKDGSYEGEWEVRSRWIRMVGSPSAAMASLGTVTTRPCSRIRVRSTCRMANRTPTRRKMLRSSLGQSTSRKNGSTTRGGKRAMIREMQ